MSPMPSGENVQVSIVIVSWNVRQHLLACLHSVEEQTKGVSFDVTIVDNASTDGTVEAVRRAFPRVHVIANAENVGFARACNQGNRETNGPHILLLNPDCLLSNDICTLMVQYLAARPGVGMLGPHIRQLDGADDLHSPRLLPTLWSDFCDRSGLADRFPRSRLVARHHMPDWDRSISGSVEGLSGACLMLVRRALEQVGLFDEGFFMFGEDVDLCLRMRRAGWQVHYRGDAIVTHRGGASTNQVRDSMVRHGLISRQRFFRKHRGPLYALAHRAVNALLAVVKLLTLAPWSVITWRQRPRAYLQWQLLCLCLGMNHENP